METYVINNNGTLSIEREHLERLKELQEQKKKIDSELKELSGHIMDDIKAFTNKGTRVDDYNFVCKGGYFVLEFDEETFKEKMPNIYSDFLRPKFVAPSYSLVKATREKKNV